MDTTIPDENVVALRSIRPVALPQSTTVSTVLVLGTESDGRQERLRSGEALSAVLLEATVGGTHDGPPHPHAGTPAEPRDHPRTAPGRRIPQGLDSGGHHRARASAAADGEASHGNGGNRRGGRR